MGEFEDCHDTEIQFRNPTNDVTSIISETALNNNISQDSTQDGCYLATG